MKNSFWRLIWQSFLEIQGLWIVFLGIVISLILTRFPFKTPIPLDLVIIISFFTLLFLFTLLHAVNNLLNQNRKLESESDKIRERNKILEIEINRRIIPQILVTQKDQNTGEILCLLEYSELFSIDMYISFYHTDVDGFERLIGVGFIQNIQSNGRIQAVIDQPISNYQNILDKLADNNNKVLKQTVIRPGIPRSFNQT